VTIANLAKVPIVPCAYSGPTNIKDVLKRKKINIIIGEPMTILVRGKEELLQKTDELSKQMYKLETEIISIKK